MAWRGWENLGTPLGRQVTSTPSIASWNPNRLDVFVQGFDRALWHKWFEGGRWSDWENLGGILTSSPAAISWGPNRIDVFGRGTDNALWHKWFEGGWSGWESLGGILTSGPAVSSWGPNRLDVFVRGTDGAIYHKAWDGSRWSDWASLGGSFAEGVSPTAISRFENQIELYALGTDNIVKAKWWDGSRWSDWINMRFNSVPAPVSRPPDCADWYWLDPNSHLRSLICRGPNLQTMVQCSESDGGYYGNTSVSSVNTRGRNRVDLVMRYSDNSVWYNIWTPNETFFSPSTPT